MRRLVMVAGLVAAVASCTATPATPTSPSGSMSKPASGDQELAVTVDGGSRSFVVHVPEAVRSPTPVVIVLHGGGGNARNAMEQSGMSAAADRNGFIAVYPNGSGRLGRALLTWNAGQCCGYAMDQQVDDVAFMTMVIDTLEREFDADPRRIFVTGMSNGGMLSYRLGCELADRVAAIAPVAGSLGVDCHPSAPVSVVAFHGTADRHVRYEGGTPGVQADTHPRQDRPVADTIAFWAAHDACAAPVTEQISTDATRETRTCANGTEVTLYTITDGGHAWPGGARGRDVSDTPTDTISATGLMWEFFDGHPRR